jgi:hypothetical protein
MGKLFDKMMDIVNHKEEVKAVEKAAPVATGTATKKTKAPVKKVAKDKAPKEPRERKVAEGFTQVKIKDVPTATHLRQPWTLDLMKKELGGEIVDFSFRWAILYATLKTKNATSAVVIVLKYFDDEVQYKVISETDKEIEAYLDAPKRMIKKLDETTNHIAKVWRAKILAAE